MTDGTLPHGRVFPRPAVPGRTSDRRPVPTISSSAPSRRPRCKPARRSSKPTDGSPFGPLRRLSGAPLPVSNPYLPPARRLRRRRPSHSHRKETHFMTKQDPIPTKPSALERVPLEMLTLSDLIRARPTWRPISTRRPEASPASASFRTSPVSTSRTVRSRSSSGAAENCRRDEYCGPGPCHRGGRDTGQGRDCDPKKPEPSGRNPRLR